MEGWALLNLLALCICQVAAASPLGEPCADPAWPISDIRIIKDVEYGSSYNRITQQNETLLLDVYLPPAGDAREKRPAAVMVHGGAFRGGSKEEMRGLASEMVRRGWVVVSVNYRLTGFPFPQGLLNNIAVSDAVEDVRAAVRFIRKNAAQHRLDTGRILVGGDSAGAFTSLTLAFVKDAQYEGNSGNPGYSSDVRLAFSISGSLVAQAFCNPVHPKPMNCKVQNLTNNHTDDVGATSGQPSVLMVHGTDDTAVPYVDGKAVYDRAQEKGLKSSLITIPRGGHVPIGQLLHEGSNLKDFMNFVIDALDMPSNMCPPPLGQSIVV